MRITSAGNVGIGTTSPTNTLSINGGLSVAVSGIKTSNYTATASDYLIPVDATGGMVTITLPSATNKGQMIIIKKIDSSANVVRVARAGSDGIELAGNPSEDLKARWSAMEFIADGTSLWYRVGGYSTGVSF